MDKHFLNVMKTKLTDQKTQQIPSQISMNKTMTKCIKNQMVKTNGR